MKIFKRNQLIILVISLMLVTAGYLNFTAQGNNNTIQTSEIVAELGDATLVSSIPITDSSNETETTSMNDIGEAISENAVQTNENINALIETAEPAEDSYFTTSKLERESMYSQMLDTYQQIYNNAEASAEQRTEAITEISKINSTKNAIMIAENLIMAKGFEKSVIFVNENSVSVIIGKDELKQEEIAQIQNIVSRELNVTVDIIHISTK